MTREPAPIDPGELVRLRVSMPADVGEDGRTILVASNLTGTFQLYELSPPDSEPRRLTDLDEPVTGRYVPGSRRVLLRHDVGGDERFQLSLREPDGAVVPITSDPEHAHRAPCFTRDGRFLAYASNRANGVDFDVYVRELESGREREVFAPGGWCEPCGFSPDGRFLTVARPTTRSGDEELHVVDLADLSAVEVAPHEEPAVVALPCWSADSRFLLVTTDLGRDTLAIARASLETGRVEVVLESEWDLASRSDPSGTTLLVEENAHGSSRLEVRDPATLELRAKVPLPAVGVVQEPVVADGGGLVAYQFASPTAPGDVWAFDVAARRTRRLTTTSAPPQGLVEPTLHRFESFDGESIPTFLFRPPGAAEAPVVVVVHGGPESQARADWNPLVQLLAVSGYCVAVPNVRGSTGYGRRYEHLDDVEKRLDSVRDLAELVRWLRTQPGVDASRAAVYGVSYGGYMVLASLCFHPELWAAGVDVVGISSLVTFLEGTAPYRRAFREREYGFLERDRELLESISPLAHVNRIRAPLLIVHGRNDPRVPLGEARQLHESLAARGVPVELVVYPDEGHGLQRIPNRVDAYGRVLRFLRANL